jgi:hypothetical protein
MENFFYDLSINYTLSERNSEANENPPPTIDWFKSQLDRGKAVSLSTIPEFLSFPYPLPSQQLYYGPVISNHAYMVESVGTNASGNPVSITLRNPWGIDGFGSGPASQDGYVTLTVGQFNNCVNHGTAATV